MSVDRRALASEMEQRTAVHIAAILGATHALNDDGSRPGQFDFLLRMDDQTVALEVTSIVGVEARKLFDGYRKQAEVVPGLRCSWVLTVTDLFKAKWFFSEGWKSLADLEGAGVREYGTTADERMMLAARVPGVREADVIAEDGGAVLIATREVGFASGADVSAAVQVAVSAPDNAQKLAGTGVDLRQLAVWIDIDGGRPHLAMEAGFGTVRGLDLPAGIDRVWVLRWMGAERGFDHTWSFDRSTGWSYWEFDGEWRSYGGAGATD